MYYPNYILCAMVKSWIASGLRLPRSEVGRWPLYPCRFPTILCSTDHLPMSLQYFLCPFGLVVNFEGIFGGCVGCVGGSNLNDRFRSLCLATCRCPHDITDRHRLELHCSCLVVACWRHGLCLEQQFGLLQHDHGHAVKDWIASWNLDIPWSKVLGLADVVPRMRVRLWLLARRSMIP